MAIRGLLIETGWPGARAPVHVAEAVASVVASHPAIAVGTVDRSDMGSVIVPSARFHLRPDEIGIEATDPRFLAVAAAAASCHLRELAVLAGADSPLAGPTDATGSHWLPLDDPAQLGDGPVLIDMIDDAIAQDATISGSVGVGPHPQPWPVGEHLDPDLLERGDRRNVVDRYRYWSEPAIVADLDGRRLPVHVAVENWRHDLNIGTVVRNANAFNVAGVHIIGRRRWNRRGAMATDRYLTVHHHDSVEAFVGWADERRLPIVGIDNIGGSVPIETAALPSPCVLVFGQEGPGLSQPLVTACAQLCAITQHGSTRSLNAGVASGIALYAWAAAHPPAWPQGGLVP